MADKTEDKTEDKTVDPQEIAEQNQQAEIFASLSKAPARTRNSKPKGTALNEIHDGHLHQEDGSPNPISVRTEHLQASVESKFGRPLLKMSLVGWVGDESIILPVADAGELREIADLLDAEAAKR